jgi:hypothetical protein
MTELTGILRNAVRLKKGEDVRAPCLAGNVYGDSKGRFRDGDWITTSTIMKEDGDDFQTRYSAYRVESWASDAPVAANDNNPMATHINEMVAHFHGKSKAAGWWMEGDRDLTQDKYVHATKLMLCVSELAEAMEGLRKGLMDDKLPHRKMAEVELADAIIRIFDLAGVLGYDLGGAVVEKSAYNTVRPDHQPGNRMIAGGKAY